MDGGTAGNDAFVVPTATIRASIAVLQDRHIHPFFPAYLHLRQQGAQNKTLTKIVPQWNELGALLEVPGGPAGRPYFRPFWTVRRDAGQEWLNKNLAGSYAPSSIRQIPRRVVDVNSDNTFALRERHWELARLHLAEDTPVPVLALGGFLLRNYSFSAQETPARDDLVAEFRRTFGYGSGDDEEFEHLFSTSWPGTDVVWFEKWAPPAEGGDDE